MIFVRFLAAVAIVSPVATQPSFAAELPNPAAIAPVQALSSALVESMKSGGRANFAERSERLAPVVDHSFDLALTTRLIAGPKWTSMSASDQSGLQVAIRKMTIAEYAKNFSHWSGEAINVDPKVEVRGGDALVKSTLTRPKGDPVILAYRMRQMGGQWRIIDVLYNGTISQLATRRADYAHILEANGARALIEHINELAAKAAR